MGRIEKSPNLFGIAALDHVESDKWHKRFPQVSGATTSGTKSARAKLRNLLSRDGATVRRPKIRKLGEQIAMRAYPIRSHFPIGDDA